MHPCDIYTVGEARQPSHVVGVLPVRLNRLNSCVVVDSSCTPDSLGRPSLRVWQCLFMFMFKYRWVGLGQDGPGKTTPPTTNTAEKKSVGARTLLGKITFHENFVALVHRLKLHTKYIPVPAVYRVQTAPKSNRDRARTCRRREHRMEAAET